MRHHVRTVHVVALNTESDLAPERPEPLTAEFGPIDRTANPTTLATVWDRLTRGATDFRQQMWPPDVFAYMNAILAESDTYRLAVSPPLGRRWPPTDDFGQRIDAAASDWCEWSMGRLGALPVLVRDAWQLLAGAAHVPLSHLARPERWDLVAAILTLHAIADETGSQLGSGSGVRADGRTYRAVALDRLISKGSLSHMPIDACRVLPKTHGPSGGTELGGFSRYMCVVKARVEPVWHWVDGDWRKGPEEEDRFTILLLPWPITVAAADFHPRSCSAVGVDPRYFGFFEFSPRQDRLDPDFVSGLLEDALRITPRLDMAVLPESALQPADVDVVQQILEGYGVRYLLAGVREPPGPDGLGSNYAFMAVFGDGAWYAFRQSKHHRWSLDGGQIVQYHLSRRLDPRRIWWEAVSLPPRCVQFLDMGEDVTLAPLICEDMARLDPVVEVVRAVGPALVIGLLLDGPQLTTRWSARYAGLLVDDPGSSVLTLTSLGMSVRSRPPGHPTSRVIALWHDPTTGAHEIRLDSRGRAALLDTCVSWRTTWTADGRRHVDATPTMTLRKVHQLRQRPEMSRKVRA